MMAEIISDHISYTTLLFRVVLLYTIFSHNTLTIGQ